MQRSDLRPGDPTTEEWEVGEDKHTKEMKKNLRMISTCQET